MSSEDTKGTEKPDIINQENLVDEKELKRNSENLVKQAEEDPLAALKQRYQPTAAETLKRFFGTRGDSNHGRG